MTDQQPARDAGQTGANPLQAPGSESFEPLRRSVVELRDVLESKVSSAWVELIEPQGELLDSMREEVRERRKRKKQQKAEYREFLEDAVTTIASQLYGLALRERAFDSLRAIIADVVSDDLASQVDSEAVLQTLRGAIATVFDEARDRLEVSSTSTIAGIKKGKSSFELLSGGHLFRFRTLISARDHWLIERDPPRPGRWVQFNRWLDSCRKDIDLVRYQGGFVLVPAIMSEFDSLLVRSQPPARSAVVQPLAD